MPPAYTRTRGSVSSNSHSHSNSHSPYLNRSVTNSLERLIKPTKRNVRVLKISERNRRRPRMASENGVQIVERKMSYGIGGAGNIRMCFTRLTKWSNADGGLQIGRPSDVIYPPRTNQDGTRRRSSVFSISPGTSPDGKRATLMELFKRKGSVSETPAEENIVADESAVQFNDVDMSGKKTETE